MKMLFCICFGLGIITRVLLGADLLVFKGAEREGLCLEAMLQTDHKETGRYECLIYLVNTSTNPFISSKESQNNILTIKISDPTGTAIQQMEFRLQRPHKARLLVSADSRYQLAVINLRDLIRPSITGKYQITIDQTVLRSALDRSSAKVTLPSLTFTVMLGPPG